MDDLITPAADKNRGSNGKFLPGNCANPKGRPRASQLLVAELARTYTQEAIETLVNWMRSNEPKASVAAASILLDRGWGKAPQPMDGDGDGGPVVINLINGLAIKEK